MRWRYATRAAVFGLGAFSAATVGGFNDLVSTRCSNEQILAAGSPPKHHEQVHAPTVDVPLPWDKLACHMPRQHVTSLSTLNHPISRASPAGTRGKEPLPPTVHRPQAVLLLPGSFNPPTYAHLRNLELARDAMRERGWDVIGAYVSPVHGKYGKKGLESADHRVKMCQLAAEDSDFIMVDMWEASQQDFQRTLNVLRRISKELNSGNRDKAPEDNDPALTSDTDSTPESETIEVVLVCGADLLKSFTIPGVWIPGQVETILSEHGVVCVSREDEDVASLMFNSDVLYKHRENILLVKNPILNNVSSSKIRKLVARDFSIKYLVPDSVASYIAREGLYKNLRA